MSLIKLSSHKRQLEPGYGWQEFLVCAIRTITKKDIDTLFDGVTWKMKQAHNEWCDLVKEFRNRRANVLGMTVDEISAQLAEEPNDNKVLEKAIWEAKKCECVWAVWATILGPVPENYIIPEPLPLFNFWPKELRTFKGAVPEIFDASILSDIEQGNLQSNVV